MTSFAAAACADSLPQITRHSDICVPSHPKLLANLVKGDMDKAASLGLIDAALVVLLGEPLAREFLDDARGLPAMEIEGLLELFVLADGLEARVDPDVLRKFAA